jgi:hypothetical protein
MVKIVYGRNIAIIIKPFQAKSNRNASVWYGQIYSLFTNG